MAVSDRTIITIITRIIRPEGAIEAARTVQAARTLCPEWLEVRHVLAYWNGPEDPHTKIADWLTELIRDAPDGWVFFIDDDNRMHPQFLAVLAGAIGDYPDAWAFLFGCAYPQFHGGVLWPNLPPRGGHVDGGQACLKRAYAVLEPWPHGGYGDGIYLANLYARAPERWVTVSDVVTSHNHQRWGAPYPCLS